MASGWGWTPLDLVNYCKPCELYNNKFGDNRLQLSFSFVNFLKKGPDFYLSLTCNFLALKSAAFKLPSLLFAKYG